MAKLVGPNVTSLEDTQVYMLTAGAEKQLDNTPSQSLPSVNGSNSNSESNKKSKESRKGKCLKRVC